MLTASLAIMARSPAFRLLPPQELRLERVERLFVVHGLVDGVVKRSLYLDWDMPARGFLISVESHFLKR